MKKIYILFLVITSYACTAQILLNGRLIHELPAKSSVDTGDLIIVANPTTGKPYKARKNQVVAGANGVTDGDKGDITVTGLGAIFTIDGSSVQNGKLAMMGNRTYKANLSGTTASPQDATSDQVIADLGINLKMNLTDTASLSNRINAKQNTLVSGSNIKSVNGNSLIGSGDLTITSAVAWGNITGSNIMLQTDLRDSFEHRIAAGTTGQYWRGDKTWQTLNKAAVGLSAVDNTADVDKPISNATNAALAGKQAQLVSGTSIKTINFIDLLGSGNITISGGSGGGETLDQTLKLGNTTDTSISINYLINNYSDTNFVYGIKNIITTNIAANDVDYVEPYYGEIIIDSGTIDNEADVYASIINKSGGYAYVLEGFGSVINVTGGTTYETRSYNSQVTIDDDITGNVIGLRHATVHTSGNVGLLISGIQNSLAQSAGTSSDITQGYSNQLTVSGSNNYIRGFDNYITIQSGTNLNTNGILNIVNATGGTNLSITGERIELNLTGGTAASSTALDVYGPNGISGDPTIAYFRSRMASSYGVVITAHASQSQSLFSIFDSSWGFLFNVGASGQTGIGSIANSSAQLTVTSTTKGFLPPRMTKTQRDAISSPATGLVIYQTDNTPGLRCYNGTNWMRYTETAD